MKRNALSPSITDPGGRFKKASLAMNSNNHSENAPKADILIVEDEAFLRTMITKILEKHGYSVHAVVDGKEALRQMEHCPPKLLITDIFMPNTDGYELMSSWRSLCPDVPIIAMSGSFPNDIELLLRAARHLGAKQTLAKPFSIDQLIEAVQGCIGTPV